MPELLKKPIHARPAVPRNPAPSSRHAIRFKHRLEQNRRHPAQNNNGFNPKKPFKRIMGDDVQLEEEGLVEDSLEEVELPPEKKAKAPAVDEQIQDWVKQDGLEQVTLEENAIPKTAATQPPENVLEGLVNQGTFQEIAPPQKTQEKDGAEPRLLAPPQETQSEEVQSELQNIQPQTRLDPVRVLEAALFLANKPLSFQQLQDILQVPRERLNVLLRELEKWLPAESAVELKVTEHSAALQLKNEYVDRVAKLSKEVELSKKAMKILALVAKKKQFLQSQLKHYFKGEIYAYVTELKQAGYLEAKKSGNTRLLRPTTKFYESFQIKE
ncbi:SMC-Scp complex subunit ScpB [Candidatus Micrarchaeota archaeon]|nr:SMC-Scp complex subunit ScpB [Candidatus Micrarchaeota archaeon]